MLIIRYYVRILFIFSMTLQCGSAQNPFAHKATFEGLYHGEFDKEKVEVRLVSSGRVYGGTLKLAGAIYSIKARLNSGKLSGQYIGPDNKAFPLTFRFSNSKLIIERTVGSITLQKQQLPVDIWGEWSGEGINVLINQNAKSKRVTGLIFFEAQKFSFHGNYEVGLLSAQFKKNGSPENFACKITFLDDSAFFESATYSVKLKKVAKFQAAQVSKQLTTMQLKVDKLKVRHSHSQFDAYKKAWHTLAAGFLNSKNEAASIITQKNALSLGSWHSTIEEIDKDIARLSRERDRLFNTPVISTIWDDAGPFQDGVASVKKGKKYGFIDREGNIISEPKWSFVHSYSQGLALVSDGNDSGFINKHGKVVIPLQWKYARSFSEGLAAVQDGGKWGYIDSKGAFVIKPEWGDAWSFYNGRARVKAIGWRAFGFVDKSGKEVIKSKWRSAGFFQNDSDVTTIGLEASNQKRLFGVIDRNGGVIVEPVYSNHLMFSEGMALIHKDRKWGLLNKKGHDVVMPKYEAARMYSDGCFAVRQNKKWGFMSHYGNWIVKPHWDDARSFKEGLAEVKKNGKWGFINKAGASVIPGIYERTTEFLGGHALVMHNGKWGVISKKGEWIVSPNWEAFGGEYPDRESEQMLPVKHNGKWGFIALPLN